VSGTGPVRAPLSVDADLELELEAGLARIRGYGDVVVVDLPSLAAARELATGANTLPIDGAGAGLATGDVTVDVRVRGRSVALAGPGVAPGPLSRLLGAEPARVSVGGAVLAALRALR
jgi:hypothetical protein